MYCVHLAHAIVDRGFLGQGVELDGGELQHALFALFGCHLPAYNAELLLREGGFLFDFLEELRLMGQRYYCFLSRSSSLGLTCCSFSLGIAMAGLSLYEMWQSWVLVVGVLDKKARLRPDLKVVIDYRTVSRALHNKQTANDFVQPR